MFTPSSPVEQPVDQSGNYSSASRRLTANTSARCAGGSCGSEPTILEKLRNSLVPPSIAG